MYPSGLNKSATDDEINISFLPTPNYAALAEAATGSDSTSSFGQGPDGWMKGARVRTVRELKETLHLATLRVGREGKGMLIEVLI
jgi:hypothetical protein